LPDQFQRFSTLLRQRRESAHLSGIELSKRAGLSLRTIKNIESGQVSPSRETVLRLLDVEELALTWKDVLDDPTQPSASSPATDTNYNCYIPPGYDSMRMVQQLVRMLNGPGGHIEQTNAYLEHRSALAYVSMCHDVEYVTAYRAKYPLDSLARRVMTEGGNSPLKVIALGAGDGYLEVRLVQHLLSMRAKPDIELLLFDISQPLLTAAYQHAIDTFGEQSAVHTLSSTATSTTLRSTPKSATRPPKAVVGVSTPCLATRSPTWIASRDFSSTASRTASRRHASPRLSAATVTYRGQRGRDPTARPSLSPSL
jgi:transcriptional regulator with XRE-family HTH domain